MAQSRPPPVRTHATTASPPPLSPRTSEKKHHSRRKSGKDYVVTEKKPSRPAPLSRKTTPQFITKVPASSSRYRERDDEERGRDSGESFPQFCMTCEKQFLPANNTFLYCSEACRLHDQPPTTLRTSSYYPSHSHSPPLTPYSRQFSSSYHSTTTPSHEDGPDIIPRFSPTQSRPRSYFSSDPYPTHQPPAPQYSTSPQTSNSSALASLRELATALPPTHQRTDPESPASSISRTGSGVWNYIPFGNGSKTAPATPGNSWSSYGGRSREDLYGYGKSQGYGAGVAVSGAGYTSSGGMGMDRPLPPRSGPGGYGHRPKSIDLVTPFGGR
ncbi:uncharacterized protein LY89DRAFT_667425 [Mollisia scopiformis]|uniref:Uncharacterized protein n=1 Tax=Mollisia scopiformis TaxID=149040 RepID=A0A194XI83_MOLSC|nr:uncharacterized protein LY89DRAFT_667425 [Mollisia scopiformis]KUJ19477.1 hypothetical protein LY89DRAFT_667425 [Mollisia scopiformis]